MKILLFTVCATVLATSGRCEEPWGRDAEMTQSHQECRYCHQSRNPMIAITRLLFRFHKGVVSPADGPRSHFKPTSSEYMMGSIEKYGFVPGFFLGCDRLMRENNDPWIYRTVVNDDNLETKLDPVP